MTVRIDLEPGQAKEIGEELGLNAGFVLSNGFRPLLKSRQVAEPLAMMLGNLVFRGRLPHRLRQLVILRTAWRTGSVYEFGQHVILSRSIGVSEPEITNICLVEAQGFSDPERAVIRAADELFEHARVSDTTWTSLRQTLSEPELIEIVAVAGIWRLMASWFLTNGTEPEPGLPSWPAGIREP